MSQMIMPRYNVVFTYDIKPEMEESYMRFAVSEFVPAMQDLDLYLARAWRTLYGPYPGYQAEFVAEDIATIRAALDNEAFLDIEDRMLAFVSNYDRRIVPFNQSFNLVLS